MKTKRILLRLALIAVFALPVSLSFTSCAGPAHRADNRQDHRDDRQDGRQDHRDDRQDGRDDRW
jgi:Ni/Co efflux regulator RcnB